MKYRVYFWRFSRYCETLDDREVEANSEEEAENKVKLEIDDAMPVLVVEV